MVENAIYSAVKVITDYGSMAYGSAAQTSFKKARCNPASSPKNMLWSTRHLSGGSDAGRVGRDVV